MRDSNNRSETFFKNWKLIQKMRNGTKDYHKTRGLFTTKCIKSWGEI